MRAASLTFGLSFILSFAVFASVPVASAQDEFEDEFDDEFDDGGGDAAAPAVEAGDEFDDAFDDEGATEEDAADAADDEAGTDAERDLRAQRFRSHNALSGPVGGLRVVDAGSGAVDSFRLQLATEFFFSSDFLEDGDENDHIGGTLSLSWTVHDMVEIFSSIRSYANSNTMEDPALFQVLGDTNLGVKVFGSPAPWLTLGGDLNLVFLNTVGDIGLVLGSTSFGLRGNATADLRRLDNPVPFVARLNMQYYFDNSAKLVEDVERQRYDALPDRAPDIADEEGHLLTRVERFALNINRTDFFNFGIGLEAPLRAAEDFYIHPLLEWTLGIPVNRQSYDCLFIPEAGSTEEPASGHDGCLDKQGFSAFPQSLSLGVRVLPPVKGLSALAAVDIGLTGTSTFVRELAATAPYNVILGLSYAYDTNPEPVVEVREVERTVEVAAEAPVKGRINGVVVEQGPNSAIAGAIVSFPGRELTALSTGADGRFVTYQLDPGEVQLSVSHPEYNDGACAATLPAEGGDVEVRCELTALPRVGTISGRVLGDGDAGIPAQVQLMGPLTRNVVADAGGRFNITDAPPGTYTARVEQDGYLIKLQQFDVAVRETTNVELQLVAQPRNPLVSVRARDIQIRRQINFATDSDVIQADSFPLMNEIADVFFRHPDIRRVEIQGHTDNRGGADHNMELSQRRADSVKRWLVEAGVETGRLDATGYGLTRPLVPNITPANRARNRRVQFMITDRAEGATE